MSNLKRYSYTSEGMVSDEELGIVGGAFVKFDDIKEFLKPAHNSDYTKCVSDIIGKVAHRLGYDLAYCSQETKSDMQRMVVELLDAHFA
jgi:hypothetical protein